MTKWNKGRDRTPDFSEVAKVLEDRIARYKPAKKYITCGKFISPTIRNRQHLSTAARNVKITLPSMPWEQNK